MIKIDKNTYKKSIKFLMYTLDVDDILYYEYNNSFMIIHFKMNDNTIGGKYSAEDYKKFEREYCLKKFGEIL